MIKPRDTNMQSDAKEEQNTIQDTLTLYGKRILQSDIFAEAMAQKHHFRTTVGLHCIHVAVISLILARKMEKTGAKIDEKRLVQACLCHDLGIVGRYEGKFRSTRDCCRRHPQESVQEAKKLLPDMDYKTECIIARHMWPATLFPPNSVEGYLITLADKMCGMEESLGIRKGKLLEISSNLLCPCPV